MMISPPPSTHTHNQADTIKHSIQSKRMTNPLTPTYESLDSGEALPPLTTPLLPAAMVTIPTLTKHMHMQQANASSASPSPKSTGTGSSNVFRDSAMASLSSSPIQSRSNSRVGLGGSQLDKKFLTERQEDINSVRRLGSP